MFPSSSIQILPNDDLIPSSFDLSKMDEQESKVAQCQKLKEELFTELNRSNLQEISEFFEKRGADFLTKMFYSDLWEHPSEKQSILETALQQKKFNLPKETISYLFNFYLANSKDATDNNMTILHLLVKNYHSPTDQIAELLHEAINASPELLQARMKIGENESMTPFEMAIETSYNETLIDLRLTKARDTLGHFSTEEKISLLESARWLSKSGIWSTAQMGERVIEKIYRFFNTNIIDNVI